METIDEAAWIKNAIEYVRVIDVREGDVIVLKWTWLDMGDGQGPWIPGSEELDKIRAEFKAQFPDSEVVLAGPWIDVELLRV